MPNEQQLLIINALREAVMPAPFTDRRRALERSPLTDLEKEKLEICLKILKHEELIELIRAGYITLGMVKPKAHEGNYDRQLAQGEESEKDYEAAKRLVEEIDPQKEMIVFALSLMLTKNQAETFYAPNRENQSRKILPDGKTIWESVIEFMSSGPVTVLLIYDRNGHAVQWWREKMGNTRPEEARREAPDSIRGKHAATITNNLVHGSNSAEEVKRELGVIAEVLTCLAKK